MKKEAAVAAQTWWRGVAESRRQKVLVRVAVAMQSRWRMVRERRKFLNSRRSEGADIVELNLSIGSECDEVNVGGKPADEMSQERRVTLANKRESEERIGQGVSISPNNSLFKEKPPWRKLPFLKLILAKTRPLRNVNFDPEARRSQNAIRFSHVK